MDFDTSISEDCHTHDIKAYSFDKLLKSKRSAKETATEDASPCSTESVDHSPLYLPVEFPLLKTLSREMRKTFNHMEELLPALPCEIGSRKLCLGKAKAGVVSTLIIEADGLLTEVSKGGKAIWLRSSKEFIKQLSGKFEIVLFLTYPQEILERLINDLGKKKECIAKVIGAESAIEREAHKIIDLKILADRSPSHIIVMTSRLATLAGCLDNGIYVEPGTGAESKLRASKEFLLKMSEADDVRPLVKRFSGVVRAFKIYCREKSCCKD